MKNIKLDKKTRFIIAVALCIVIVVGITVSVVLTTRGIPKGKTVAYIGDLPISYGEFSLIMSEQRGDVVSYFYENYHIDESKDFWDKDTVFGDECPLEVLKSNVLETLKTKKAEQLLMIENKVVKKEDLTYENFYKLWQNENETRQKTIDDGGVVYGPEQYSEVGYYNYLQNMRKIELREILFKKSDSVDSEDRFTNALIDKKVKEKIKDIEVKKVESVFNRITALEK